MVRFGVPLSSSLLSQTNVERTLPGNLRIATTLLASAAALDESALAVRHR